MTSAANEYSKLWENYYKGMSDPLTDITDLTMKSFKKTLARNTKFMNEFIKAKKVEDIVATHSRFMAEMNAETMEYLQQTSGMLMKNFSEANSQFSDMTATACKTGMTPPNSTSKSTGK